MLRPFIFLASWSVCPSDSSTSANHPRSCRRQMILRAPRLTRLREHMYISRYQMSAIQGGKPHLVGLHKVHHHLLCKSCGSLIKSTRLSHNRMGFLSQKQFDFCWSVESLVGRSFGGCCGSLSVDAPLRFPVGTAVVGHGVLHILCISSSLPGSWQSCKKIKKYSTSCFTRLTSEPVYGEERCTAWR